MLAKNSRLVGTARGESMREVEAGTKGTVVTGGAGGLTTYDGASLEEIRSTDKTGIEALALSPDSRLLAYSPAPAGDELVSRPIRLISAATHEPVADLGGVTRRSYVLEGALDFSADGTRLVAGLSDYDQGDNAGWQVWDVAHPDRPVRTVDIDGVRFRVALSPRGDTVYVATRGPERPACL